MPKCTQCAVLNKLPAHSLHTNFWVKNNLNPRKVFSFAIQKTNPKMKKYLKTVLTLMSFFFCNNILAEEVEIAFHLRKQ